MSGQMGKVEMLQGPTLPRECLTDPDVLRILVEKRQEAKMVGHVRAKGKCPMCGAAFVEIPKLGFLCYEHKTIPKKFHVDLPWKGERVRVFSG